MEPPTLLSFVVTCKGRLQHLVQTLPALAASPGAEVVVVDYDCPDGTADWVRAHHPGVQVVKVDARPTFNLSHARNLGAAAARGDWLAFVDADTLVAPGFGPAVLAAAEPGIYLQCVHGRPELSGSAVVPREAFRAVGGYDEVFEGWGAEDSDLYLRLERHGLRRRELARGLLDTIRHAKALRTAHYRLAQAEHSWLINRMYMELKHGLAGLGGAELPLESRRGLYRALERDVLAALAQGQPPSFAVGEDWQPFLPGLEMQRTLTLRLRPAQETTP